MINIYFDRLVVKLSRSDVIVHMNSIIKGEGALVNPSEKHQYRNKGDKPFKMICGVLKEFE